MKNLYFYENTQYIGIKYIYFALSLEKKRRSENSYGREEGAGNTVIGKGQGIS